MERIRTLSRPHGRPRVRSGNAGITGGGAGTFILATPRSVEHRPAPDESVGMACGADTASFTGAELTCCAPGDGTSDMGAGLTCCSSDTLECFGLCWTVALAACSRSCARLTAFAARRAERRNWGCWGTPSDTMLEISGNDSFVCVKSGSRDNKSASEFS